MPAPLNANELHLSRPALPASRPSQGDDAGCMTYQFDPESDPEGEAPEEIQTLWLQQDVSE